MSDDKCFSYINKVISFLCGDITSAEAIEVICHLGKCDSCLRSYLWTLSAYGLNAAETCLDDEEKFNKLQKELSKGYPTRTFFDFYVDEDEYAKEVKKKRKASDSKREFREINSSIANALESYREKKEKIEGSPDYWVDTFKFFDTDELSSLGFYKELEDERCRASVTDTDNSHLLYYKHLLKTYCQKVDLFNRCLALDSKEQK